jgi:tRNA (guanine-N7-)-methyltransferase
MARIRNTARLFRDPAYALALSELDKEITRGGVFRVDPEGWFSRPAPIEVEIGAGKGDFIVARARAHPTSNFLAIELGGSAFHWLMRGVIDAGLPNVRALHADARSVVNLLLPAASVAAFHIYFPDPWPKNRHQRHRLFSPPFVAGLARCIRPDGVVYLATDVQPYFCVLSGLMRAGGFELVQRPETDDLRGAFGRKFERAGRQIFRACYSRSGLSKPSA